MTRSPLIRGALAAELIAAALLTGVAVGTPTVTTAQPAQWSYDTNPATGNARATYPGDVRLSGQASAGCAQFDAQGGLTSTGAGCGGGGGGVSLSTPQTWTATQTLQGGAGTLGLVTDSIGELVTVQGAAPASTVNFDVLSGAVQLYTAAASANWTLNLRGNASTTLNSVLATGQSVTVTVVTTQGATPFFNSAVTIDGTAVTPKWQNGAPAAGNASGLDVYAYSIIKTGSGAFTVLASLTQFK